MKARIISFLVIVSALQAGAAPLRPLKRSPRKFSLTDASSSVLTRLTKTQGKLDPNKIKIPQYMLDLFSLVADKNGNRKADVALDGSVVRSFFNEGELLF